METDGLHFFIFGYCNTCNHKWKSSTVAYSLISM